MVDRTSTKQRGNIQYLFQPLSVHLVDQPEGKSKCPLSWHKFRNFQKHFTQNLTVELHRSHNKAYYLFLSHKALFLFETVLTGNNGFDLL